MEIRVNARLKLGRGVYMNPGVHSDAEKEFHPKIYDEIDRGKPTITVLSPDPKPKKATSPPKDTTTLDQGSELDTETEEPKPSRRRKK